MWMFGLNPEREGELALPEHREWLFADAFVLARVDKARRAVAFRHDAAMLRRTCRNHPKQRDVAGPEGGALDFGHTAGDRFAHRSPQLDGDDARTDCMPFHFYCPARIRAARPGELAAGKPCGSERPKTARGEAPRIDRAGRGARTMKSRCGKIDRTAR